MSSLLLPARLSKGDDTASARHIRPREEEDQPPLPGLLTCLGLVAGCARLLARQKVSNIH